MRVLRFTSETVTQSNSSTHAFSGVFTCDSICALAMSEVHRALASKPVGLTSAEAGTRRQQFGPNTLQQGQRQPIIVKFLANFTHLMALLLWVGGVIGFAAQMPQLGIAIWSVNLINGAFSFWQEFKTERATEALRRLLPVVARVRRDGNEQRIPAEALVPGDVILLAEGDHISADARLVQEAELRVDQSTLTGESHPVRKTSDAISATNRARAELSNLVFAGTSVAAGTGTAVVFATGMNTEFGKITHLTQSVSEELSPLQREMGRATKAVTALALVIGAGFGAVSMLATHMTVAESFIFAMGMIVAFVPEGLLPTVTLALAMGTQRMAQRNALVKRLSAVETLGCTSVICTDKTGTLTENEMTVRDVWLPGDKPTGRELTVTGAGYGPEGQIMDAGQPVMASSDAALCQMLVAAGLCNDARLLPPNDQSLRWSALGDPTEVALKVAALKGGIDSEAEARRMPRVRELPFDSRRKRMCTMHRVPTNASATDGRQQAPQVAYVKGAPKEVLALCSHVCMGSEVMGLDDE